MLYWWWNNNIFICIDDVTASTADAGQSDIGNEEDSNDVSATHTYGVPDTINLSTSKGKQIKI